MSEHEHRTISHCLPSIPCGRLFPLLKYPVFLILAHDEVNELAQCFVQQEVIHPRFERLRYVRDIGTDFLIDLFNRGYRYLFFLRSGNPLHILHSLNKPCSRLKGELRNLRDLETSLPILFNLVCELINVFFNLLLDFIDSLRHPSTSFSQSALEHRVGLRGI
jgi:hypothetical protein